jgi:hypothetical protein
MWVTKKLAAKSHQICPTAAHDLVSEFGRGDESHLMSPTAAVATFAWRRICAAKGT